MKEKIITTKKKCPECGENYILTLMGWICPNCSRKDKKIGDKKNNEIPEN